MARCTTTQGFPVVEVGPGKQAGAGQEVVCPEWGLHPGVSCWPRPWDCEVGTASLSGPPLGQGHLCREGKGWLRALSRLEEQAGGGDMGGPPTASHLPPGLVILFLFCSSPLLCSLPRVPSEGASGLL